MWSSIFLCLGEVIVRVHHCWGAGLKIPLKEGIGELHPPDSPGWVSPFHSSLMGLLYRVWQAQLAMLVHLLFVFFKINFALRDCPNPEIRARIAWHSEGPFREQILNSVTTGLESLKNLIWETTNLNFIPFFLIFLYNTECSFSARRTFLPLNSHQPACSFLEKHELPICQQLDWGFILHDPNFTITFFPTYICIILAYKNISLSLLMPLLGNTEVNN